MYTLYHSQEKGVTASVSWKTDEVSSEYTILGLDIPLQAIQNLLSHRSDMRPGILFLVHPDGEPFIDSKNHAYINQVEGSGVEFKATIHTHLVSGRQGKEIELAWLKAVVAYLNSNCGAVLVGVIDAGEICGVGADEFDN